MLTRTMPSYPKDVHPLRSRVVFFLRDWSLTFYIIPFALMKISLWSGAILLVALISDKQLQRVRIELVSQPTTDMASGLLGQLRQFPALFVCLCVLSAALFLIVGMNALFAISGLWLIALLFLATLQSSIPRWIENGPRRADGTIDYFFPIAGPTFFLLVVEPIRVATVGVVIVGHPEIHPVLIGSIALVMIALGYWGLAPVVAANDCLRARRAQ